MQFRKDSSFFASLSPLKKRGKLREQGFYTFDCETKDGLVGKRLFCWGLGYRTKGRYSKLQALQGKENLEPLFEKLREWKDKQHFKVVWVHNLTFDARFLIHYMAHQGIEYFPIVSGSNMLALVIDELKVRFVDSVQFLKTSQEEAEIEWNCPEEYRKIDCKAIFEKKYGKWNKEEKKQVFDHNANDVKALHEVMREFRNTMFEVAKVDVLQTISLAGLSLKAFRKQLPIPIINPFVYKRINKETNRFYLDYDDIASRFARASYYGGRTEVMDRRIWASLVYMDKVSMYPFVMKFKPYPSGNPYWLKYDVNDKIDELLFQRIIEGKEPLLGMLSCKITPPKGGEKYPVLPKRIEDRVMFLNTKIEGIYTTVELQYAYERGYTIEPKPMNIQSHKAEREYVKGAIGLIYPFEEDYFSKFVDVFFGIKSREKGGRKKAAKIILNSTYGKFGQKFEQESPKIHYFTNEYDAREYQRFAENPDKCWIKKHKESRLWIGVELEKSVKVKPFMNITIASFVTAYARLELIKQMHKLEQMNIPIIYTDTDSIVFPKEYLSKMQLGKNLGNWGIEKEFEQVRFLAPKAYYAKIKEQQIANFCGMNVFEDKMKIKLKGTNKAKLREIEEQNLSMLKTEKLLREPIEMAERYMNFRESHRAGLILASKTPTKHYSFANLKRYFDKTGQSKAWEWSTIPEKFKKGTTKMII